MSLMCGMKGCKEKKVPCMHEILIGVVVAAAAGFALFRFLG